MLQHFRKLILVCMWHKSVEERKNEKKNCRAGRKNLVICFLYFHLSLYTFSILCCVWLADICACSRLCKWDKRKKRIEKRNESEENRAGKRELNWFCATIKWKCFIYLSCECCVKFFYSAHVHYSYYYLCLFFVE